jgi:hypothetical protein
MTASNVTHLPASAHAHADLLSALFIALREGVRCGRINPKACEGVIGFASRSDCGTVRLMLEQVLKTATRGDR